MLKLIGDHGKSVVANAMQKFSNTKVYVYDEKPVSTLDSYFINSKKNSMKDLCEFIISDLKDRKFVDILIVYTNLSDIEDVKMLEEYMRMMELDSMVGNVILMTKN